MNLIKLLMFAGIVWLVLKILKSWRVEIVRRPPPPGARTEAYGRFEPMARCARCGLHLPVQALSSDGRCGACQRQP